MKNALLLVMVGIAYGLIVAFPVFITFAFASGFDGDAKNWLDILWASCMPMGIVASLIWWRGMAAENTTVKHGGFVGFYVFLFGLINPLLWFIHILTMFLSLLFSFILIPLLGYWVGKVLSRLWPSIALPANRINT